MPKIFDNISEFLNKTLLDSLQVSYRSDFCVGYFNLRSWKLVADQIDRFDGKDDKVCRVLVGMQKHPYDTLREYFSIAEKEGIDNKEALRIKKNLAKEFKDQLTIGLPTQQDE